MMITLCDLDLTVSPWRLLPPKVVPVPWRGFPWGENWVFGGEMRHTGRPGEETAPSFPTCKRGGNVQQVLKKESESGEAHPEKGWIFSRQIKLNLPYVPENLIITETSPENLTFQRECLKKEESPLPRWGSIPLIFLTLLLQHHLPPSKHPLVLLEPSYFHST